jgi:hypothetical protein
VSSSSIMSTSSSTSETSSSESSTASSTSYSNSSASSGSGCSMSMPGFYTFGVWTEGGDCSCSGATCITGHHVCAIGEDCAVVGTGANIKCSGTAVNMICTDGKKGQASKVTRCIYTERGTSNRCTCDTSYVGLAGFEPNPKDFTCYEAP